MAAYAVLLGPLPWPYGAGGRSACVAHAVPYGRMVSAKWGAIMAGHYDSHTSTLLVGGMGIDQALGFHLGCRVFPPQPEMFNTAKTAIRRMTCAQGGDN